MRYLKRLILRSVRALIGVREAPDSNRYVYAFEDYELDEAACELFRSGHPAGLQVKPTRLLLHLIENRDRTVPKAELLQAIWPDNYITESAFTTAIGHIRQALEDDADCQRLIRTFRGRGYRFVGAVERRLIASFPEDVVAAEPGPLPEPSHRRMARRSRFRVGFVVAAGLALTMLIPALLSWYRATEKPRDATQVLAFEERDWVLISNFENKTGETLFDSTLERAMERTFVNSGFVNVVPRERIQDSLRLMRKPADAQVDATLGREICLRDGGILALLSGQSEKLGATYVLSVQIVDPSQGLTVANLSVEAQGEDQVWPAIRRLASSVRDKLAESISFIRRSEMRLAKVTTTSLRALRLFSEADSVIARGPADLRVAEA